MNAAELRAWVAGADELTRVAELLGDFRDSLGREKPTLSELQAAVEAIAAAGDGEYLLAAGARRDPAGVCQLRFRASVWTSSEDAWIEDVFVLENARASGLGRALVELAIERARARGCRRIELDVDEGNTAALSLYRGLGFAADLKADVRSLLLGRRL